MDIIWEKIKNIAESGNGYIKTRDVETAGISRPMIKKYKDAGKLTQIRKGLYILTDGFVDEFALLQIQSSKSVYSYGTALYLWGLSDRTPHILDITLPHGTNASHLKKNNSDLRCHYVSKEIYELGITEAVSPQGATVKLYDKERCICDLIQGRNKVDVQIYSQAIKDYFRSDSDIRKLFRYGKTFGIVDKIRIYTEVL